ncbi:pyridoxine/pyridoxamine 5'-phosphate oxidase [Legionella maioricensis]|uniref:Pyridoxamine 5'-phosphate oxidase family protein n=1 Tax=Legionella maioricensis TaxID=2896528 RepID=A0A9X2IBX4_9GAMM|nr:pyridoxamine 5'-phosphate oxidase family protein [Legionella maioricensis]MCL9685294.1 pyridoxamine 5'-phosphate oxidase family protein [Legionella maioricensis]MCL9688549.1 pyridoxamine 5'-phosphate oxidase family protein [Legionella maioricensis]
MIMKDPINLLKKWLEEEKGLGVSNPQQAVLSTATLSALPRSRVVAIREINEEGMIFFTQKGTRKVTELINNPVAALTFWFEMSSREVIIEGTVVPLSVEENEVYWNSYPREAQIRFYSYAATSATPIASKEILAKKKSQIELEYHGHPLPMSEFYCGFRFIPDRLVFYAYRIDELSDVAEYVRQENSWMKQLLSP